MSGVGALTLPGQCSPGRAPLRALQGAGLGRPGSCVVREPPGPCFSVRLWGRRPGPPRMTGCRHRGRDTRPGFPASSSFGRLSLQPLVRSWLCAALGPEGLDTPCWRESSCGAGPPHWGGHSDGGGWVAGAEGSAGFREWGAGWVPEDAMSSWWVGGALCRRLCPREGRSGQGWGVVRGAGWGPEWV